MCCYEFVFDVMVLFFISLFVLALYSLPRALSLYIVYIIVSLFLSFRSFSLLQVQVPINATFYGFMRLQTIA